MKKRQHLKGLYAITDSSLIADSNIVNAVELAINGGCRVIQYRDKSGSPSKRLQQARALQKICRHHNTVFIINDDIELARQVDADGVHLGREDITLREARHTLGHDFIIGVSCYNQLPLALQAEQEGADYVAFGRFFPSRIKPDAVTAEPEILQQAKQQLQIPVVAIGGIDPHNAGVLIDHGADMLAVISAIFAQKDIQQAAGRIAGLFPST